METVPQTFRARKRRHVSGRSTRLIPIYTRGLRFWCALFAAIVIVTCVPLAVRAVGAPSFRTYFDRRVDTISDTALLTLPPQALVDPARQRAARTITDVRDGVFLAGAFAQIWAFAWLWSSGNAARLRDALRRRLRSRIARRAAFGAALGALAPIAGLPFAFISYRVLFNVGLTEEHIGGWIVRYVAGMLPDAFFSAIVVALVLELVDRTRLWYLGFIAFLFASAVIVVAADPVLFPAPTMEPRTAIHASVPVEIANVSQRSRTLTSRTAGIGPFTRILLGDVLADDATPPEVAFAVAREAAHVRHNDVLKMTLIATTLLVFAIAIAVLISDRIRFRRDDDAESRLALVGAFLGGVALVMLPLYNAYARGLEYRADEDARQTLARPVAAVRLLVRSADDDLTPLCYRRSSSWYFATLPALGSRIAAMRGTQDPCPHSPATR